MNRVIALAALALTAGAACQPSTARAAEPRQPSPSALKVETEKVSIQKMPRYLTLTGSVMADRQSEVAANVVGRIIGTYVERGQLVREGQVLAIVDAKGANLSATAAAAQSQAADTQVNLAKQECERADTLFKQGAIPKSEFDRMKTQCTAQLYSANAARAQADLAAKLAGDSVIRAPIAGVVGERYVNVGEYVQPMNRVASIYAINPVRLSVSVPEPAVGAVKEGQTLEVEVSAYPGRRFPAVVKFVSPNLRPNTRDLIIEASAKNDEGALRPGMFATVQLLVGEEELPTVPLSALKVDGTVRRIFLAKQGQAYEMVVKTGVEKSGRRALYETLTDADVVILNPPPALRDGAAIQ